jgi:hypothetical protein
LGFLRGASLRSPSSYLCLLNCWDCKHAPKRPAKPSTLKHAVHEHFKHDRFSPVRKSRTSGQATDASKLPRGWYLTWMDYVTCPRWLLAIPIQKFSFYKF